MKKNTFYDILARSHDASEDIIKNAYRELVKKYHPDIYKGSTDYATRKMKMINQAYETLSDPIKRKEYDMLICGNNAEADKEDDVVTDIIFEKNNPQPSDAEPLTSNTGCSGCLSNIIGVIIWIVIISFAIRACSGGQSDPNENQVQDQSTPSQVENDVLIEAARNVEMLYFHKPYTDLGTVDIYEFTERDKIISYIVSLGKDKEILDSGQYLTYENKLLGNDYWHITSSTTKYYYVGDLKGNKPHGLGAIVGVSDGSGTYSLSGELIFYYVGNFKNGMKDGFGVEFNADECDITAAVQNIIDNNSIDDKYGEHLCMYLFNHVSYEGYWNKNEYNGKGNLFEFPMASDRGEDCYYFYAQMLSPLDNYIFGHAYPWVTTGEWDNGKMTGQFIIYEFDNITWRGELKDGKGNGQGTRYYTNGQIEYDGEWKNGEPHGYGSYYDADGKLIYSGEWKYGDYAH